MAIARALVARPQVLFADEPTGALDTGTSRDVLRLLRTLVAEQGQTIIMVTHDPIAAAWADRVVFLADGRIAGALDRPTAEAVAARMTQLEVAHDAHRRPRHPADPLGRVRGHAGRARARRVRDRHHDPGPGGRQRRRRHQAPERFAAAPFVIQADPSLRVHDADGVDTVPLLQQPDVPASAIAALPAATADRSFYAQLAGVPATQPTLGHGWSSAAFAPYRLSSGHPPRTDGQIVVAGRAALGRRVTVLTAGGPLAFTIVGTVRPRTGEQPIFFTDAEAARLSPGVDALVTDDPATARRAAALPGAAGADRRSTAPGRPRRGAGRAELAGLTTFLGIAAAISGFVAITVIASAFGLSVAQRRRDLALLRTIGATPAQVARMVRRGGGPGRRGRSAAGCLLGVIWAPLLARWIAGRGLSPAWFSVQFTAGSVPALVIAFLAGVAVAVVSVLVAARRAGLIRPTEALREAAVEPSRIGPARLFGGLGCLVAGIATLVAVAVLFPSATSDAKTEAMIVLLLVGGAVLLAPFLVGPLTRPFGRGTAGMLIRADVRTGPGAPPPPLCRR